MYRIKPGLRRFVLPLIIAATCIMICTVPPSTAAEPGSSTAPQPPVTGKRVELLEVFDRAMRKLITDWKVPGGSLAVAKDGRLVLARGYGWADVKAKRPVEPRSLFRIASISKPITAAVILRLVEQKKLALDDRVLDILGEDFQPIEGEKTDPRFAKVTLRQLLHHTGGWDRDKSFDPMFIPFRAAKAVGTSPPADPPTIIRYMLGRPLDFDPGTRYAYSNFGFSLLGRVIEKKTGRRYDEATLELVLRPAGITRMRLGHTRVKDRPADEVLYYHYAADELARSVFPDVKEKVPWPDGGFHVEAFDAHGGWIGSATDLLRFATATDGSRAPRLLSDASLREMTSRPAAPLSQKSSSYYALGWGIRRAGKDTIWSHTGSIPGTTAMLRRGKGLSWAVLLNTRPQQQLRFKQELEKALDEAGKNVRHWPTHDLFAQPAGS